MGFFSNYEKAGAGIDKNAPKKRGFFLFFELLGRYWKKIFLSNMLYTLVSIPVLFIYHYIFLYIFGAVYGADAELSLINNRALILTVMIAIFWGTGPVSCGFAYLLRGMAREEHVWISYDFFDKSKKSFKHGLVFLIIDLLVLVLGAISLFVYSHYVKNSSGLYMIPVGIIVVGIFIYTMMHFYIYQFEITFENTIKEVYKNSLIMTVATFPMCLLISGIICSLSYFMLGILPNAGVVIIAFLFWVVLMRFMMDFYTARLIKRRFLKESTEESEK